MAPDREAFGAKIIIFICTPNEKWVGKNPNVTPLFTFELSFAGYGENARNMKHNVRNCAAMLFKRSSEWISFRVLHC